MNVFGYPETSRQIGKEVVEHDDIMRPCAVEDERHRFGVLYHLRNSVAVASENGALL
jgi:hypothetical protein